MTAVHVSEVSFFFGLNIKDSEFFVTTQTPEMISFYLTTFENAKNKKKTKHLG